MLKKIITKEEKDRKLKRNQLFLGFILIAIMIFSTLGFAFSNNNISSSNVVNYKNVKFVQDSGYWKFNVNNIEFLTLYNPTEIEDINFLGNLTLNDYSDKPLYFFGERGDHNLEIERNLLDRFILRISPACIDSEKCEQDLPVKNCKDDYIIVYKVANNEEEKIYQENKCVYIIADVKNQGKYADVFLFKLLGLK